jgi:hypothetical protein
MKTPMSFLLGGAMLVVAAAGSFAADEPAAKEGCKMMAKKEAAPAPAAAEPACCCEKMMAAKSGAPAKTADLNSLVDKLKTAKGDQVLDAFAAVLNEILTERKAAHDTAPDAAAAHAEHQH